MIFCNILNLYNFKEWFEMSLQRLKNSYKNLKEETGYDIDKLINWIRTDYIPSLRLVMKIDVDPCKSM